MANELDNTVKDPVCGMMVKPAAAAASAVHDGKTFYFCAKGCRDKFQSDPHRYLISVAGASSPVTMPADKDHSVLIVYTCPMHPEVRAEKPGPCPICGMALESIAGSGKHDSSELHDMTRRLKVSTFFSLPLVVIGMSQMLHGHDHMDAAAGGWLWAQLVLALPVVCWAALPFFRRGIASIQNRNLNMFTLLSLGIAVPFAYSFFLLIQMAVGNPLQELYFESAAMITTLALLGQVLELRARTVSTVAVRQLMALVPETATRISADGQDTSIPVSEIVVGDKLRIRPGERMPVDAHVESGRSLVDESMLTGEPGPVVRETGDDVHAGTINGAGVLLVSVTRTGAETLLGQIIRLVGDAQRSRVPIQQLADRASAIFVPAVLLIAAGSLVGWLATGHSPGIALTAAVATVVIACPCALGLATPMAIVVATGRAAKAGVLFKDARALQKLAEVRTLVLDKTGTLTEGKPAVQLIQAEGLDEARLIQLAASVESGSEHPLGRAIVKLAEQRAIATLSESNVLVQAGEGIAADVDGCRVLVGSAQFLKHMGTPDCGWFKNASALEKEGQTVIFVAVNGSCSGLFAVHDPIRHSAQQAVSDLKELGFKLIIATGDGAETAQAVAARLEIADVYARMKPADKAELVRTLQAKAPVAFIGDGINDAVALAESDAGIAMGGGTDVAMHTSDLVILGGDLGGVKRAVLISRAMVQNIKQNLFLAFAYNLAAVPIAAGIFYPLAKLTIDPMLAAAAMAGSSLLVIGNSLRMRGLKL